MLTLFIQGLLIGFAIAAPLGPLGVLCIQRSLYEGFKIGLMTGLGVAAADGVYGLIPALGLTALSSFLIHYQYWIRLAGGLFLLYWGIKLFFTPPPQLEQTQSDRSACHAFGSAFFLTMTNPATALAFIAVFASLGLGTLHPDYQQGLALVAGITAGSAIWWLFLSSFVAFILHHRLSPKVMSGINKISGLIIGFFGVLALTLK